MMRIALVAAVAENRVIGNKGALPWHLPGDLRRFRTLTMGKPVIMGRLTWESIMARRGEPLAGRNNIVVSRTAPVLPAGVWGVASPDEALDLASGLARDAGKEEVMIIGGRRIYEAVLPRAARLYLTEVAASPAGDVCFPPFDRKGWREVERETPHLSEGDNMSYTFVVLERR